MLRALAAWLSSLSIFGLSALCALADGVPASGLYQIVSGRYTACCGIAGPFRYTLPEEAQGFVELKVAAEGNLAQMTFLGQDMQTVFRTLYGGPDNKGFAFVFTNGVVSGDRIQFGNSIPPPVYGQPFLNYTVSNFLGTLSISGTIVVPCPGCADIPEEFEHTNVVALLMPAAVARVSEMEVCWSSAPNRLYQVQYRSALSADAWTNLGAPVAGDGSTKCVADKVPPGQPQRFYRVLSLP